MDKTKENDKGDKSSPPGSFQEWLKHIESRVSKRKKSGRQKTPPLKSTLVAVTGDPEDFDVDATEEYENSDYEDLDEEESIEGRASERKPSLRVKANNIKYVFSFNLTQR